MKNPQKIIAIALSLYALGSAPAGALEVNSVKTTPVIHNTVSTYHSVKTAMFKVLRHQKAIESHIAKLKSKSERAEYTWDQVNYTINDVRGMTNTISGLMTNAENLSSAVDGYLMRFKDLETYRSLPCYTEGTCTDDTFFQDGEVSKIRKKVADAVFRSTQSLQKIIVDDSRNLEKLQQNAMTSRGQMQALQSANQLALAQVKQLLNLSTMISSLNTLMTTQVHTETAEKNNKRVADDIMLRGKAFEQSDEVVIKFGFR